MHNNNKYFSVVCVLALYLLNLLIFFVYNLLASVSGGNQSRYHDHWGKTFGSWPRYFHIGHSGEFQCRNCTYIPIGNNNLRIGLKIFIWTSVAFAARDKGVWYNHILVKILISKLLRTIYSRRSPEASFREGKRIYGGVVSKIKFPESPLWGW